MATAKKLKSGSWRCLVYDYTDENGKRKYKSFTCDDSSIKGKHKAEKLAAEYSIGKGSAKKHDIEDMSFEKAMDNYINKKEPVLSPSTIKGYKYIKKTFMVNYPSFCKLKISSITNDEIQIIINSESKKKSSKTVRNYNGFISAVMENANTDFKISTTLPQKNVPILTIPSDNDIKKLLHIVSGTEIEVPIMLAAFGPMRASEVCALTLDDINGNIIHVSKALVKDYDGNFIVKFPKTTGSDRYIDYPAFVIDAILTKGYITTYKPGTLPKKLKEIQIKNDIPLFRFHDLRHYSASIMHAMGIPDAYIMQRGGWKSDTVLKSVYRHSLSDKEKEMNNKANKYFSKLCNTKMQHD